ncbi:DUF4825 domain-containing protein [Thomasclavelia sp.]|uniref:DUF4825 domain-containing protein n=1 Tax=Thomasclavelia sp. TaxID=3025757 RepID=UPI0025CD4E70|nr:DUF4825 domain-containing protein [Thomasclavelia sp.]
MNQEKIGKFIAENRKLKKMTQVELAEKLGVSDRSVSKWENGKCMMDLSLFEPLCKELDISINELLSGERISKEEYQEKLEENIVNTIDYSKKEIEKEKIKKSYIIMIIGAIIGFSAFIVFDSESSWGSIYSIIGIVIFVTGLFKVIKVQNIYKRLGIVFLTFIVILTIFYVVDMISVISFKRPPIYRYMVVTEFNESKLITYHSLFYNVYRINADSENEYYIVDLKKEYNSNTVPISPFNRDKSGIDNIIKYQNKYLGNNSNTGNLITNLPLSNYGYVFEIDSENYGLIINYNTTDWYNNDDMYIERSLIYNSVAIFMLIDNLKTITFNFSGSQYIIEREVIENNYPNYNQIIHDGKIDKDKFNHDVENKMNDIEFVKEISGLLNKTN